MREKARFLDVYDTLLAAFSRGVSASDHERKQVVSRALYTPQKLRLLTILLKAAEQS